MENILYPELKVAADTNHFSMAEKTLSPSKTDQNINRPVRLDRCLALRKLSEQLNLNEFTVHQIFTEYLYLREICAKMVPINLTS